MMGSASSRCWQIEPGVAFERSTAAVDHSLTDECRFEVVLEAWRMNTALLVRAFGCRGGICVIILYGSAVSLKKDTDGRDELLKGKIAPASMPVRSPSWKT